MSEDQSIIADAVLTAIASQPKGLAAILEGLGSPIDPATWYRWLQNDEKLRERYARAKADQARVMADEISEIADTVQVGEVETIKGDGTVEIRRGDMLEHRKLRIEARKWLAAKLLPKVYGEKLSLAGDAEQPLEVVIRRVGGKTE